MNAVPLAARAHWACNGPAVRDPQPRQIDRPKGRYTLGVSYSTCARRDPTPERLVPLVEFLTGLYSAFSNSALERLGYWLANMTLISHHTGR
jgi:hypothetical protein